MEAMIDAYNAQVEAYHRLKRKPARVEDFVDYESGKIAWSRDLKNDLLRYRKVEFVEDKLRPSLYRPFTATWLFFDRIMNEEVYGFPEIFPTPQAKNLSLCITDAGSEKPFMLLATDRIADLHLVGAGASSQCFPLYRFVEDSNSYKSGERFERRDNITIEALTLFQEFYDDDRLTGEAIFHYVYALLHHPAYRTRYAENLKRGLPRIPFVGIAARAKGSSPSSLFSLASIETMRGDAKPDHDPKASAKLFRVFAAAGEKLSNLHVNYESAKEFPLKRQENKAAKLDWRVEAMKLSKDKASLFYNDFLTLSGIPAEAYGYRLGNRSALEWVIDQYRVSRDEHGNIVSDPNNLDDEQYIVRLIGSVVTVSLETMKIVNGLPVINC